MSQENDKKSEQPITPAKQPLPPVQEVEETDLDGVAGGTCTFLSCVELSCGLNSGHARM